MFTLRLREASTIPIDMTGILPETLEGLTLLEAAKKTVRCGNRVVELGELFQVGPERECKSEVMRGLRIEGDCANLHNIGRGMTRRRIYVHGSVGRHTGALMKDGCISINGDAGDWTGAEMSGGRILVENVGSQVGAAYRGSRRGMTGGWIFISGNAGDEVGLRMRRGCIKIYGNCGTFAGAAMIAGTLFVRGKVGEHLGAGMKRGTILTTQEPSPTPGFRFACEYQPQFMHLLNEEFRGGGELIDEDHDIRSIRLYRGDLLTGGRGELWHITT